MSDKQFVPRSKWYFITPEGKIDNFIVHSGLSPQSAITLDGVFRTYATWQEANEALTKFNKVFTYFTKN